MDIYYEAGFTPEEIYIMYREYEYLDLDGMTYFYDTLLKDLYEFAKEKVESWSEEYREEIRKKTGFIN